MSKYVPKIEHRTRFQGDEVVAVLEPLEREQFIRVSSALDKSRRLRDILAAAKAEKKEPDSAEVERLIAGVSAAAVDVLGKNLDRIDGVRDNNGNAVPKEVILSKVFFMSLVNELFDTLAGSATLGEESSGASEGK